jgi:hypothetical protein
VITDDATEMAHELVRTSSDRATWSRCRLRIEAAARRWSAEPRRSVATVVHDLLGELESASAPIGA